MKNSSITEDRFGLWFTIIIIILCLGVVAMIMAFSNREESSKQKITDMTSREVALMCTTDMATEFHIHPEIKIFAYGKEILIPADTGITPTCMHSIHTHNDMPIVHVEAQVQKDFTIGDFFAVWQKEFSKDQLMEYKRDEMDKIKVTVNGSEVDTYENTILRDKDKIVISIEKSSK